MKQAGKVTIGAVLAALMFVAPAAAEELSEKSVRTFVSYAWSLVPQQFTTPSGKKIVIDKSKPDDVMVPLDVASQIIRVGRISAHAQICNLPEDQRDNYRSMMKREGVKKKWSPQQMVFISQLHLTTVMLLTGKIKVTVKDGDKEVVIDDGSKAKAQTCSDEQRAKVKEVIAAYVKSGPALASAATGAIQAQPAAKKE